MANVRLEKSVIESVVSNVTKFSNEMNSQLTELYSVISRVKEIWHNNLGAIDYVDNCSNSVKSLNSGYASCCTDFLQSLQQIMAEYELEDARTAMKVSSKDGVTIATMAIGAGGFSDGASGFDFGKVSKTPSDVANGNFVEARNSEFGEGEYTFQYRNDGTVKIDKNGTTMAFTTKENADKITGGVYTTSNSTVINNAEAKTNVGDENNVSNYEYKPVGAVPSEKRSIKLEQADGSYNNLNAASSTSKPLASNTTSTLNAQTAETAGSNTTRSDTFSSNVSGINEPGVRTFDDALNKTKESHDSTNWQATFTPIGGKK